jgi:hypothetical protein
MTVNPQTAGVQPPKAPPTEDQWLPTNAIGDHRS